MPKSVASYYSLASDHDNDEQLGEREAEALRNSYLNTLRSQTAPVSPVETRRDVSSRASDIELRGRLPQRSSTDETTGLLAHSEGIPSGYNTLPASAPGTPRYGLVRNLSYAGSLRGLRARHHSRRESFGTRLARALSADGGRTEPSAPHTPKSALWHDDRVWYDQFTSTDWVRDSIADAYRVKELRGRKDWRGRLHSFFDGAQGWILVAIIGVITAGFAYFINITEVIIFDYKMG